MYVHLHTYTHVHCTLCFNHLQFLALMPTQVLRGFNQVVMLRKTSDAMKTSKTLVYVHHFLICH
jgi:hypothetical protein